MKKYTHLFFDLDHTLWDYEANSCSTLEILYSEYNLAEIGGFTLNDFTQCFTKINDRLWDQFHAGEVNQDFIREHRFKTIFDHLDSTFDFSEEMGEKYISLCPTMGHIFPGALETLNYLSGKYELHIITNGFKDVQHIKLSTTGLDKFFDQVIISANTNYRKPQKEIFHHALDITSGQIESSIMIGDSIESDIKGAKAASMDQVLFNPNEKPHNETVTFEIKHLNELIEIGF